MKRKMKDKGKMYCTVNLGQIGVKHPCKPGKPMTEDFLRCKLLLDFGHWHTVFEDEEGHAVIDWDHAYTEDGKSLHQCYNCGTFESKTWHSPHLIPAKKGYVYCVKCFRKLYPKGHKFVGLKKTIWGCNRPHIMPM